MRVAGWAGRGPVRQAVARRAAACAGLAGLALTGVPAVTAAASATPEAASPAPVCRRVPRAPRVVPRAPRASPLARARFRPDPRARCPSWPLEPSSSIRPARSPRLAEPRRCVPSHPGQGR